MKLARSFKRAPRDEQRDHSSMPPPALVEAVIDGLKKGMRREFSRGYLAGLRDALQLSVGRNPSGLGLTANAPFTEAEPNDEFLAWVNEKIRLIDETRREEGL